ncbi:carboxylesterase/lipase family protein [Pseudomonas sp. NPDC089554]|uniref:carboxylesterase/lipase family protein n=1 Tax=Pseudomonas sp. NPDC089554 TaxID=3390653 RepID=UPI003D082E96
MIDTQSLTVRIDSGPIAGLREGDVIAFKGIPYAAAPVGLLRWQPPQDPAPWVETRNAFDYGNDCMQKPYAAPLPQAPQFSEDCLYLNVWSPAAGPAGKPVLVWIHGGGFVNGSAARPHYSGAALAAQGIVVVSFNYRFARFGVFAHPQLTRQQGQEQALGNYGFMDQIAALQWVQRNIAAFGGNPGDITVMGESAGGVSTHALLTSPQACNLIHKAVILSGGDGQELVAFAQAERAGEAFAAQQGIEADDPQAVAKLRQLAAIDIRGDLNMATLFEPAVENPTHTFPCADGKVAVDILDAYRNDRFNRVPVMIGATSDDLFGPQGSMVVGAKTLADLLATKGLPVYRFRFTYVTQALEHEHPLGAPHSSEIPYFMGTLQQKYGQQVTERDWKMCTITCGYLVNFVKAGNPNGQALTPWPVYLPAERKTLDFLGDASVVCFEG